MIITFKHLKVAGLPKDEWKKMRKYFKFKSIHEEVRVQDIIKSNDFKWCIWALRCVDEEQLFKFLVKILPFALEVFEKYCLNDKRPRRALTGLRRYNRKQINREHFISLLLDAEKAAQDAKNDACWAAASALAMVPSWDETGYVGCDVAYGVARSIAWDNHQEICWIKIKKILKEF